MKRLALVSCSLAWAVVARADDAALELLIKALGSQRDVRACMVQTRTDGDTGITVSVTIVPGKGIFAKVIKPFPFAGMVSYDNGDVWRNYDPQRDLLRIEASPARFQLSTSYRKKLIEKNYAVSLEREALVAGRTTRVVALKAKHAEVADRRLYIDSDNSLILRYISDGPEGKRVTLVDTISVELGRPTDVSEFESIGAGAAKVEKAWGPIDVRSPADAARYTGFAPLLPSNLPSGFDVQAIHVVGKSERPFVGVRLTDGMAVVTVYLWSPGESEPFKGESDAVAGNGIRCKVVGEVAERLKGDLARLFTRGYAGQTSERGTYGADRRVQDVRTTGGSTGRARPKLVIDNEES